MPDDNSPYDPLDYYGNLTVNLVRELMSRGPFALPVEEEFQGPGVYALFYKGDFEPYRELKSEDSTLPIYVGKAEPPGGRKGGTTLATNSPALLSKLNEHTRSIEQGSDLSPDDFTCRYLVVVPLWIKMAERFLLEHYQPAWNVCLDGFGNHDPGAGRRNGEITWWDAMHPGRSWAKLLRQTRNRENAISRLSTFLQHQDTLL